MSLPHPGTVLGSPRYFIVCSYPRIRILEQPYSQNQSLHDSVILIFAYLILQDPQHFYQLFSYLISLAKTSKTTCIMSAPHPIPLYSQSNASPLQYLYQLFYHLIPVAKIVNFPYLFLSDYQTSARYPPSHLYHLFHFLISLSETSKTMFFFFQFYCNMIDTHYCISLRRIA